MNQEEISGWSARMQMSPRVPTNVDLFSPKGRVWPDPPEILGIGDYPSHFSLGAVPFLTQEPIDFFVSWEMGEQ